MSPAEAPLSARVRRLEISPTVAMAQRAMGLKSQGVRVYDFTVGEPDQPTPPAIVATAYEALKAGRTRYAPAAGLPELRDAVVRRYREDWGTSFAPEQVTATVGGKQALAQVFAAILDRGSEVVVPTPCWPTFLEAPRIAGGKAVPLRLRARDGFRLTARALGRALGARTRAIVVNSPCNPTGTVVAPEEMVRIAHLARRRGVFVVLDDTYSHLIYREGVTPPLAEVAEAAGPSLVIAGTMSKSYCMTGWRLGWVIGSRPLAAACAALNSHSIQSPATFVQVAAAAALSRSQKPVRDLAEEYRRRRAVIHPAVAALPGVTCPEPEGGFYLFPDLRRLLTREMPTTLDLAARLLEEEQVAVVPGEGFAAPGHVRLSFASSLSDLRAGARRMARFFERDRGRR